MHKMDRFLFKFSTSGVGAISNPKHYFADSSPYLAMIQEEGVTVEFERNVYYQMFHLLKKSNGNRLVSFPVQVQMYAKRLLHRCRVRYSHVAAACL